MRVLANENFPAQAVEALRSSGHDVVWMHTDAPGSSDAEVLERAVSEERILITFDKDFGELVFRRGMGAPCGVILFRISPTSPRQVTQAALAALQSRTDWAGHFAVVEESRIRLTSLPTG